MLGRNFTRTKLRSVRSFGDVKYFPMPRLSPSMTDGKIRKWYLKEGDRVHEYQLAVEISTSSLFAITDRQGKDEESVMLIELVEDMVVGKLIGKEGTSYKVGAPIAILCDDAGCEQITQHQVSIFSVVLIICCEILNLDFRKH